MPVEITNKTKAKIRLSAIKKVAEIFLLSHKIDKKTVSIVFIGDRGMERINGLYRKKNKPTDVLSFRQEKNILPDNDNFFGEILIDYQQIKRQAKERGVKNEEELIFILVHGLFHLLGYDDKTGRQAEKMEDLGNKFIKKIGRI